MYLMDFQCDYYSSRILLIFKYSVMGNSKIFPLMKVLSKFIHLTVENSSSPGRPSIFACMKGHPEVSN